MGFFMPQRFASGVPRQKKRPRRGACKRGAGRAGWAEPSSRMKDAMTPSDGTRRAQCPGALRCNFFGGGGNEGEARLLLSDLLWIFPGSQPSRAYQPVRGSWVMVSPEQRCVMRWRECLGGGVL